VKLYATELIEVLSKQLTSASWNAKKQSAQALKGVSEVMGKNMLCTGDQGWYHEQLVTHF